MRSVYPVSLSLCVAGVVIRTGYELLKKAGRVDTRNKVVFSVVFVGMVLMLTSWFIMGPSDPWRVGLPAVVRWLGLGASVAGLSIALGGWIQLRGLENIDHLVTSGLFSKIRHPMYTGFILWIAGWIIFYGAAVSVVVGLVCVGNILYWRRFEEEKLASDYGEDYRRYRAQTWF
jgi:protein-S-isoprenylcysteine O-methyltransferase Ste14